MTPETKKAWIHSLLASGVAIVLSLLGYAVSFEGLNESLFLCVPFLTGLAIAFMSKGKMVTAITAMTSLLLSLLILVISGLQGIVCVLLALPILFVGIGSGALVGYLIGKKFIHQYGNVAVVALCAGSMALVGWTNGDRVTPESLRVKTSMKFHAPIANVWDSVIKTGSVAGDDTALRLLGLPIPYKCTYDGETTRVCFFEEGEMVQKVTRNEFGKTFQVDIVKQLEVRDWLTFDRAGYEFIEHGNYVAVIRTDHIVSTLQPRWYWQWLETKCIQLEHQYVMSSMKAEAESSAPQSPAGY